jgi:hypothetical protein
MNVTLDGVIQAPGDPTRMSAAVSTTVAGRHPMPIRWWSHLQVSVAAVNIALGSLDIDIGKTETRPHTCFGRLSNRCGIPVNGRQ